MDGPDLLIFWVSICSIHITGGNGLQCLNCNKVQDVTQCINETQCGIDENCFIERYGNLPYATFILGCLEHEHCPTQPSQGFTLVGRALQMKEVPTCRECCTTDRCNSKHCDIQLSAPPSTTAVPCNDHESDCPHLNTTVHVCGDVQTAKKLCRKYCGLCALVDGAWNVWSDWTQCSVSCGRGTVSRMRSCNKPAPSHGGLRCTGTGTDTKSCHLRDCPVHGGWATWGSWSSCNTKCGLGISKRNRTCTNPTPSLFGHYCFGDNVDTKICNGTDCTRATPSPQQTTPGPCTDVFNNCDLLNNTVAICTEKEKAVNICQKFCQLCGVVDGQWSYWSDWQQCSVTCGNGTTGRARTCTNPSPANGGNQCVGSPTENKACNERECPVHGGWSMWNSWSTCTATCGTGLTHRRRDCDNPSPYLFGTYCYGDSTEYNLCVVVPCSVNGGWSAWTSWESCSVSCGKGMRKRRRNCNNPSPAYGGSSCFGDTIEYELCQDNTCLINGGWSAWTSWESCSVSCGKGMRKRRRNCNNPSPAYGGNCCFGDTTEYELCQDSTCPIISFAVNSPSSTSYPSGNAIRFLTVVNNVGGGYSTSSGKFTAPAAGKYLFSLNVRLESYGDVFLSHNSKLIGDIRNTNSNLIDASTLTYVLDIQQGDTVWAYFYSGSVVGGIYSSFTGVRIQSM